ncbi:MAG TPA: methyl-accepting chemotaxis protein [Terriglobales bacterium]|nr:methyl-accepting chemotaxis protein [Terriglobales bacterium]
MRIGIAQRMMLVMVASVVITVAAILSLAYLLRVSSNSAQDQAAAARTKTQQSFELFDRASKLQSTMQKLAQSNDPDAMEALVRDIESRVAEAQARIRQVAGDDSAVASSFAALTRADDEVKAFALQGRNAESHQAMLEKATPAFESFLAAISAHQNTVDQKLEGDAIAVRKNGQRLEVTIFGVVAICVAVMIAWGVALVRGVARTLRKLIDVVKDVAEGEGDLTKRLQIASQDELGQVAQWFNTFLQKLHHVIAELAQVAEHVASASEQLSASFAQQAQSVEMQKNQSVLIANAMQQMSSSILQVSDNANKAAGSSRQAAETARHGGAIVDQTLNKMQAISESVGASAQKMEELGKSSDQIGRIINVIDDIADQTNLLALNAAIEAARAGEQGRGFAVVADEVRKLAERTTTATKEIAQMIKNIQNETKTAVAAMEGGTQQVEDGVQSTSQAGESLKEIIRMSEQVGNMIVHIATASTEQSSASEEINKNAEEIARLVKESAVGAQQSAKACQDLAGLALALRQMVGNFKLEAGDGLHGTSGSAGGPACGKAPNGQSAGSVNAFAAHAV